MLSNNCKMENTTSNNNLFLCSHEQKLSEGFDGVEQNFKIMMGTLLELHQRVTGIEAKMQIITYMFDKMNEDDCLEILLLGRLEKWITFGKTVYKKTSEYEKQRIKGEFTQGVKDLSIAEKFIASYTKTRENLKILFTMLNEKEFLETYKSIPETKQLNKKNIDTSNSFNIKKDDIVKKVERRKRNVPVVDYTGMDVVDPPDENDHTFDIWVDNSIKYDPDYTPYYVSNKNKN